MTVNPKRPKVKDEDFEVVAAIQNGQDELFHQLVERYEKKLYNFGLRMCGDACDAEDLVQDTLLNVFRYLKDFRYETKFKNWLYRIATSTCIKKRRKSKFAPDRELSLDEYTPDAEAPISAEPPEWAQMPLDQVLNEELTRIIKDAILTLPEKYRLVMVLRDLEGFSTAETAQLLNLQPSNVKVRLHRARLFLRDKLKGYFEDEKGL
jgi:RNA polymerase sigma-70 factor (ECF subfamily)